MEEPREDETETDLTPGEILVLQALVDEQVKREGRDRALSGHLETAEARREKRPPTRMMLLAEKLRQLAPERE